MSDFDLDSLNSHKLRKLFDEDSEGGEENNHRMKDEYSQGFRRLKSMGLDENMWNE